jgi:hypothetical protein
MWLPVVRPGRAWQRARVTAGRVRFMEHLDPRAVRVIALIVSAGRERWHWYFRRYSAYLRTAGEIVFSILPGMSVPVPKKGHGLLYPGRA